MIIFILCLRNDLHLLNDEFNKLVLFFQQRSQILQPKKTQVFHEFVLGYPFSPYECRKASALDVSCIRLPVLK